MSTVNLDLFALWQRDRFVTSLTNRAVPALPAIVAGDTWAIRQFFVDDDGPPMSVHRFEGAAISIRFRAAGNNTIYAVASPVSEITPAASSVTRAQAGGNFVVEKQDIVFESSGGFFKLTFPSPGTSLSLPNGQESFYCIGTTPNIAAGASANEIRDIINSALRWYTFSNGHTTGGPYISSQVPASALIVISNWTQYHGFRIEFGGINSGSLNNYVYALPLVTLDDSGLLFNYGWNVNLVLDGNGHTFSDLLIAGNGPAFFEVLLNGGQAAVIQLTADPAGGNAPAFTNGPPPNAGSIGSAYDFTYTASGFPVPTFSLTSGSLPPGLSLTSGGRLSGTPTASGTFSGVVTATNTSGSITQAFSITIGGTGGNPGPGGVGLLASYRNGNFNVLEQSDGAYFEDRDDEWPGLTVWHIPYVIDFDYYLATKPAIGSYEGPFGYFWKDTPIKFIGDGIVEFERLRHNIPGDANRPISTSKNYQINDSTYQGAQLVDPAIINFGRDITANCNFHYALDNPGALPVVPFIQVVPYLRSQVLWDLDTGFPTRVFNGITVYNNNYGVSNLPGGGVEHVLGRLYCRKILTG